MSRIVIIEHVTLDGVMQGPARADEDTRDGFEHGGWGVAGNDPAFAQQVLGASMGRSWSLLVGRITYQDFAKVWPGGTDPMSKALDNVEKFVASTTLAGPLPWINSTQLQGDAVEAIARLKREHDKTLVIFGSGVLVHALMRHDLIDEYVLQIHPLVLGKGRRLFANGQPITRLHLIDSVTAKTGVIIAKYQPASSR